MERKIYSQWAFTENEKEKARINYEIYKEDLEPKSKQVYDRNPTDEELEKFTCFKCVKNGYGHNKYIILSNPNNFTYDELALICDRGNLCFGYRIDRDSIIIYTD